MAKTLQEFYEEADVTRTSFVTSQEIRDLKKFFEPNRSDMFLDIGCYDGLKTKLLAEFIQAKEVHGIDFLTHRLELAKQRGIQTKQVDLNAEAPLPYPDNYFDCIYCGDVIEHIFSPDYLLAEIHRLLRPGGYALIRTPNLASWRNRVVLLFGYQPFFTEVSTKYRVGNPRVKQTVPSGHIRVFTMKALSELSQKYKLEIDTITGIMLSYPRIGMIGHLSHIVDIVAQKLNSGLCDEMVAKLRKPLIQ